MSLLFFALKSLMMVPTRGLDPCESMLRPIVCSMTHCPQLADRAGRILIAGKLLTEAAGALVIFVDDLEGAVLDVKHAGKQSARRKVARITQPQILSTTLSEHRQRFVHDLKLVARRRSLRPGAGRRNAAECRFGEF